MGKFDLEGAAYLELTPSRGHGIDVDEGDFMERRFVCRWDNRMAVANSVCPVGSLFSMPTDAGTRILLCSRVVFEPYNPPLGETWGGEYELCQLIANYREPRRRTRRWNFSHEFLELGRGRKWENAGSRVDIPVTTIYPSLEVSVEKIHSSHPFVQIYAAQGKVNSDTIEVKDTGGALLFSIPPGHVLYTGAEIEDEYDLNGSLYWRATHTFIIRPGGHTWNEVWRAPRQKVDAQGDPMFVTEANQGDYPDLEIGDPIYIIGDAGTGGWDVPVDPQDGNENTRYLYGQTPLTDLFV